MTRTEGCARLVLRLGLNAGRVTALAQRCAEAGLLPKANGRDIPDLGALELARLFLCAVADKGLGNAASTTREYAALTTEQGVNLLDVMEGLFAGRISATSIRQMIIQLSPAGAVLLGEAHLQFGASLSTDGAAKHVIIPGDTLAAIALEFQNLTAEQADNAIAIGRLAAALQGIIMNYNPGAVRSFSYPSDKFSELPRSLDEWNARTPSIAQAWAGIRQMATQGHPLAAVLVKIDAAQSAKKIADAEGSEVPSWARETLSFLDEYQDAETENLDEALALLNAAL